LRRQQYRLHSVVSARGRRADWTRWSVDRIAEAHGATAGQVALAWLLQRSPVILPITGTLRVAHLEENVAAAGLSLMLEEIAELDAAA
jgi:pyridoxine 4-dehydrogenase